MTKENVIVLTSRGILHIPYIGAILDAHVCPAKRRFIRHAEKIAGWGAKPSGQRARRLGQRYSLPVLNLEDGFLRSFGTGDRFPPLSLVIDDIGIYYDSTQPSALENLLNSGSDILAGIADQVSLAKRLILDHQLSKYNHAPPLEEGALRTGDRRRILVVDQTSGDLSVSLGGAGADSFTNMLAAARAEHPDATIYVKTHPEVSSGRKAGYLSHIQNDERTVVLRDAVNPLSLIAQMDHVYVVTSTMGFEALLAGKPVTCFGLPWYAGWGATDDRQICNRRSATRSIDELFAAAYFHYTRYIDPVTHQRGTIFNVVVWLVHQKEMTARLMNRAGASRMIGIGFRRWKQANLAPMLALNPKRLIFVRDAQAASRLEPAPGDNLAWWGREAPRDVIGLAQKCGAGTVRIEDGFIRSVGLGSDLIAPLSLVLDKQGIYFDPRQSSDLEDILNNAEISEEELKRARDVREFIVAHGLTKYNMEPRADAPWRRSGKTVILVPGQVEDDASIRFGCTDVRTNIALLKAARAARPDAFIVYKPHPDVVSGNRTGKIQLAEAQKWADHIEMELSVTSCIDACAEVHTMTSLTGFDALLRGKHVVTYGQPFYAGWGLTEDKIKNGMATRRRKRRLTLEQLVAGVLLRYPLYWDPMLKGYTSCEAILRKIVEIRSTHERAGTLERLRAGFFRRQWRKGKILARSWLAGR